MQHYGRVQSFLVLLSHSVQAMHSILNLFHVEVQRQHHKSNQTSTTTTTTTTTTKMTSTNNNNNNNNTTTTMSTTNQDVVPQLIQQLYQAKIEEVTNSNGTIEEQYIRDPHLRLRRTLTPSLNTGMSKYNESQFIIHPTTGKRETIQFQAIGEEFYIDVYSWGASEKDATVRMFGLHGISPAASRIQWHSLGDEIQNDSSLAQKCTICCY